MFWGVRAGFSAARLSAARRVSLLRPLSAGAKSAVRLPAEPGCVMGATPLRWLHVSQPRLQQQGRQPWVAPEAVPSGESLKKYGIDLTGP